jgi:YD repeat-containing protein
VREDADVVLGATPPFVLRRTYRTNDRVSREFGVGSSHNGEWYLYGDGDQFQWLALVLADGGQIRYDRVSSGASFWNAMYEHWETPTEFYASRVGWNGTQWVLREYDGSVGKFLGCGWAGSKCSMVEWLDADGHATHFRRDATPRLTSIESGSQRISFEYDRNGRIQRVIDQANHTVSYSYDASGRLRKAVSSEGVTRSYDYDDQDRVTRIEEPGRIVQNAYDATGRCIRQRAWFTGAQSSPSDEPYTFEASYKTSGSQVVETTFVESGAPPIRYAFNAKGALASETYEPDTEEMVAVKYDRDALTNLVSGLTVSCRSGRWHFTRSLPATSRTKDQVKQQLLAECSKSRRAN